MAEIANDGFTGTTLNAQWTNLSNASGSATVGGGLIVLASTVNTERARVQIAAGVTMADGDVFTVEGDTTAGGGFYGGGYINFTGTGGSDFLPTLGWTGGRFYAGYTRRDTPNDWAILTAAATDGLTFARLRRSGSALIAERSSTYGGSYTSFATLSSADGLWGFATWASAQANLYSNGAAGSVTTRFASVGNGTAPGVAPGNFSAFYLEQLTHAGLL